MTIEEAQARILELEGKVEELTTERDTLSQDKNKLATDLENARVFNQKLFERVSNTGNSSEEDEDEPDVPTCEEYAKTINII